MITELAATNASPASMVFSEYMSHIIKRIPNSGDFAVLGGTTNGQASFYFQSPTTHEINSALYNKILAPRVKGTGSNMGVDQAELEASTFTGAYASVYNSMIYQLSTADQAAKQTMLAQVAGSVTSLTPAWNSWVSQIGSGLATPIPPLPTTNTDDALSVLSNVMFTEWVDPQLAKSMGRGLIDYTYANLSKFNAIFSEIPLSVPATLVSQIQALFSTMSTAGAIQAKQAAGTSTLNAILNNIQNPSPTTGAMSLTKNGGSVPGRDFEPADPITIVNQLAKSPPASFSYKASITKSSTNSLTVSAAAGAGISIPVLDFFSVSVSGSAQASIFQENYVGTDFEVEVVVNNPVLMPLMTITPQLFDSSTGHGWLDKDPVREAIKNGSNTDVTGFVFTSTPSFDFAEGGDFGYVESMLLSQFLELHLTFKQCQASQVQQYFHQQSKASFSFLGIPLGGASQSSTYTSNVINQTSSEITIALKPNPPGYTPGGTDITQSLCNLIGVGVNYPLAP